MNETSPSLDALRHKNFYRALDAILRRIDEEQGLESMLTTILSEVGREVLGKESGIESGRLYKRDGDQFVVVRSFGALGKEILGTRVPDSYPVLEHLRHSEVSYFDSHDSMVDPGIESTLGVGDFAAFFIGPGDRYIAAFGLEPDADAAEVMLILNSLRYAITHRLREITLEGQIREAQQIQMSLLPAENPRFEGFQIAGRSIPAEQVGGDIYDFLPLADNLMGIAVGDASGHGLSAALQARDVITGLRMGVEKDLKITAVLRRLNHVIHRGGLTSRFVSLFYGELESSGTFVYCNAGHDPVLLLRADGSVRQLRSTGIVMGPLAEADYRRELIHVERGDVLVFYTDGVIERHDAVHDEEYGSDRLVAAVRRGLSEGLSAQDLTDRVLDEVFEFGQRGAWNDDVTLVLVRREP